MKRSVLAFLWLGCGEAPEVSTEPTSTEPLCAEPVFFELTLGGSVTEGGTAAPGAEVWLEERNWRPTTVHGQGQADAQGRYRFEATELPIIEGCWGWATGFFVVARQGDAIAEHPLNSKIVSAWLDGGTQIDVDPLQLEAP